MQDSPKVVLCGSTQYSTYPSCRLRLNLDFVSSIAIAPHPLPMLDYGDVIYRSTGKGALERLDVLYHLERVEKPLKLDCFISITTFKDSIMDTPTDTCGCFV